VGDNGAGAHRARLERDEQFTPIEPPSAEALVAEAKGIHLRVTGALAGELARVVCPRHDVVAADEHGANGDVVVLERNQGFLERQTHEPFVAIHGPYRRRCRTPFVREGACDSKIVWTR